MCYNPFPGKVKANTLKSNTSYITDNQICSRTGAIILFRRTARISGVARHKNNSPSNNIPRMIKVSGFNLERAPHPN